jgi:serine protease Do
VKRIAGRVSLTGGLFAAVALSGPARSSGQDAVALPSISESLEAISQHVSPAVVQIFSQRYAPEAGGADVGDLLDRQESSGSGVIVDPGGYVITNAHVVVGARRVQVLLAVGAEGPADPHSILAGRGRLAGAQVVGLDRETDLAVLKIPGEDLPHLELGDSDDLRPGQLVLAFGSPRGLMNSVSMGVVSSKARQLGPENPMIYIQTDATINPGNSGGPLVDAAGRVVGINTFILTASGGSEGIGFAAPSNIVENVYRQIRLSGRVRRGEIGVHAQTITPLLGSALGLSVSWGVILGDVVPDGPAERAGLESGDVVLSLNGKPMENGRQLEVNLYRAPIGQEVNLEVLRGAERRTFQVEVIERQDDGLRLEELVTPESNLIPELGILGLDLDRKIRALLPPLRRSNGVLVAGRASSAPPGERGFEPGDVIHRLNGKDVQSVSGIRKTLEGLAFGTPLAVQIERGGRLMFLALEIQ